VQDNVAFVLAQSLFAPLQSNIRFFRHPVPAVPLIFLTVTYLLWRKTTGLPRSAYVTKIG